jgi:ketosteroid isomerase-like protein
LYQKKNNASMKICAVGIRAADANFEQLANAGDGAGIAEQYYTADAVVLPPNSPPVKGTAAIAAFWTGFIAAMQPQNCKLETTHVEASGDLASGVGAYSFVAGGALQTGKYLVTFRRQPDGSYKCAADAFGPNA